MLYFIKIQLKSSYFSISLLFFFIILPLLFKKRLIFKYCLIFIEIFVYKKKYFLPAILKIKMVLYFSKQFITN